MRIVTQSSPLLCALCASLVTLPALSGCQSPARTTRLQTRDFEDIAAEVASSLRGSEFILERGPHSPQMTIAVTKVENLTTDILSEGEKWYLIDRVMDSDAMATLQRERNIRFVIPAERLSEMRERDQWAGPIAPDRAPTHSMTAALRSVTRSAGTDRTDLYAAFYRITSIDSGETLWTGEFLLKRAAAGRAYN